MLPLTLCLCSTFFFQELGSKMDFVIVRPGGLKSEPATGQVRPLCIPLLHARPSTTTYATYLTLSHPSTSGALLSLD